MPKFVSPKYPELRVHLAEGSVKFRDGAAVVADEVAEQLGDRYAHLGVKRSGEEVPESPDTPATHSESQDGDGPAGEKLAAGAPSGNASRGEWAKYAESLGIDPGDMKRDDIIEAVSKK